MSWLRRSLSIALAVAVWVTAAAAALAASVALHFGHEPGRRLLARALSQGLSGAVDGSVRVGALPEVGLGRVVVRDLVARAPHGHAKVLAVREATFRPAWAELLRGRIVVRDVSVRGARLWLRPGPSGKLSLVEAFTPAEPPSSGGRGVRVEVAPIRVHEADAFFDLQGKTFAIRNASALLALEVRESATLRFDRTDGTFVPPAGPIESIACRGFSGAIHPGAVKVVDLRGRVRIGRDAMRASIEYFDRDAPPFVELGFATNGATGATISAIAVKLVSRHVEAFAANVKLTGAFGRMADNIRERADDRQDRREERRDRREERREERRERREERGRGG